MKDQRIKLWIELKSKIAYRKWCQECN